MLKIAHFLINSNSLIDLVMIFNILCYFLDIIQSKCFDPSRVGPSAENPLTHASTMQIIATFEVASKWYGSVQRWHLGQY